MDDEDLGKNIAGVNIVAKKGFETPSTNSFQGNQSMMTKPLEEFFRDNKDSIGFKIVENMKKEIKKNERKMMIEEKMDQDLKDKQEYLKISEISKIKKDHRGIGFDQLGSYVYLDYEDQIEENFNRIMKGLVKNSQETKKEKSDNRIGFAELGGGVNDKEIYSKYEVDVKDKGEKKSKNKFTGNFRSSDFLKHFKQHQIEKEERIQDREIARIPKDYDPYKKVKKFISEEDDNKRRRDEKRRTLSVKERAMLLQEDFKIANRSKNPELVLKTQSFINKLSEKSKTMLLNKNRFVHTNEVNSKVSFVPSESIYKDSHKNERYHIFSLKQKKLYKGEIRYPLGYRASQIKNELEEFANMYASREKDEVPEEKEEKKTEKEQLLFKIEEMKKKIEKNKRKRIIEDWVPDRVLCIRFKVQQPKKKILRQERKLNFEKDVLPEIQRDLQERAHQRKIQEERELEKKIIEQEEKEKNDGIVMPDENDVEFEKPDEDLFDSIFNNDDF